MVYLAMESDGRNCSGLWRILGNEYLELRICVAWPRLAGMVMIVRSNCCGTMGLVGSWLSKLSSIHMASSKQGWIYIKERVTSYTLSRIFIMLPPG